MPLDLWLSAQDEEWKRHGEAHQFELQAGGQKDQGKM